MKNGIIFIVFVIGVFVFSGCLTPQGKAVRNNLFMNYLHTAVSTKAQNDVNDYSAQAEKRRREEAERLRQADRRRYYSGKLTNGCHYEGYIFDNKFHGFGTLTCPSGEKYVGQFRDGKYGGQGTYTWPSGEKYVGQLRDGKRSGHGTHTSSDGCKYVGQYRDGKRSGHGRSTYINGVFVGEMKEGRVYKGTFTGDDETIITGIFGDGIGTGTIIYPDGRRYEGEWNGNAKFLGATIVRGHWTHERPHGFGKMTYLDGTIKEGSWRKGEFFSKLDE